MSKRPISICPLVYVKTKEYFDAMGVIDRDNTLIGIVYCIEFYKPFGDDLFRVFHLN